MARPPQLTPEGQFPGEVLAQSVQKPPDVISVPASMVFTWNIATVADAISPWGRNIGLRDRQLREFWPSESFLAGAMANASFRNAAYEWEIRGSSTKVEQAVADIIRSAIAGDSFGWTNFVLKFSQDLYGQDNGAFVELIRDPGIDANSKFKNENAPVLGIAHMDSNQCTRTGNPEFPVIYTDRRGKDHKLAWYQVIPFSDYPSSIEKMNGVGVCAVTRSLRLAQIMRSIFIFKDEKVSGRHYKSIHMVSGVSKQDIKDIMKLGKEDADNFGQIRYIDPAILASLDPEKPVSTATIDLANLPDGFDFDEEMKWYISGLALCFGVDYQEFAPLPGGAIGSSNQSMMLNKKSSGKGPAMFMKIAEALLNYGVLPRGYEMVFEDLDEQRELDKQTLRKLFQEEMALALRNGFLTPDAARKIGTQRGFYTETEMATIPTGYGEDLLLPKQNFGDTGGNTISEDSGRTGGGAPDNTAGGRLRKSYELSKQPIFNIENIMPASKESLKALENLLKDMNPITVNVPAPIVNINVPEQPTPIVNVPAPVVNVAAPIVNVTKLPAPVVNVQTPKVKREVQKVVRDHSGNIESTETEAYYE